MELKFRCKCCEKKFKTTADAAGDEFSCPKCNTKQLIPSNIRIQPEDKVSHPTAKARPKSPVVQSAIHTASISIGIIESEFGTMLLGPDFGDRYCTFDLFILAKQVLSNNKYIRYSYTPAIVEYSKKIVNYYENKTDTGMATAKKRYLHQISFDIARFCDAIPRLDLVPELQYEKWKLSCFPPGIYVQWFVLKYNNTDDLNINLMVDRLFLIASMLLDCTAIIDVKSTSLLKKLDLSDEYIQDALFIMIVGIMFHKESATIDNDIRQQLLNAINSRINNLFPNGGDIFEDFDRFVLRGYSGFSAAGNAGVWLLWHLKGSKPNNSEFDCGNRLGLAYLKVSELTTVCAPIRALKYFMTLHQLAYNLAWELGTGRS